MMWQAKLKAWAVGLGLTAATLGGTGYLATTGVGQGPPVPAAGRPGVPGVPPMPPGSTKEDATKLEIEVLEEKVKQNQQLLKAAQERLATLNKPAKAAKPMSAELRTLREEHLKALTLALKSLVDQRRSGMLAAASTSDYIDLSGKYAEAETSLAANERETTFWVYHRDRMKELRIYFEQRVRAGILIEGTVHQVRAAELAAEIRLLELGAK